MGNGLHQISTYEEDYHDILVQIVERIPVAYARWSLINDIPTNDYAGKLDVILKQTGQHINKEAAHIFSETKLRINEYLNLFEVAPSDSIDEFKLVFFICVVFSDSLKSKGLLEESKMILATMLWVLDYRLKTVGANRDELTRKLFKMVQRGGLPDETGKFGVYLLYKCLYNHANQTSS